MCLCKSRLFFAGVINIFEHREKFVKDRNKELEIKWVLKSWSLTETKRKEVLRPARRHRAPVTREILLLSGKDRAEFGRVHKSSWRKFLKVWLRSLDLTLVVLVVFSAISSTYTGYHIFVIRAESCSTGYHTLSGCSLTWLVIRMILHHMRPISTYEFSTRWLGSLCFVLFYDSFEI